MKAVVDEVVSRLWTGDESLIRIPDICDATGVNYGSVYHHFGSREGVIDAAYNELFRDLVQRDIDDLSVVSHESADIDEFLLRVQPLIGMLSAGEDRRKSRAMRARIVAAALTRPELATLIGETESRLTAELRDVLAMGQDRGFVRQDVSAWSLAVLVQAVVFGRVLNDIAASPVEQAEWASSMVTLFRSAMMSDVRRHS